MGLPHQQRGLTMNSNIEQLFEKHGVDKVKFYYRGTPIVNNAYTTCLFINTEKERIEARGVAICSVKDTYSKKAGKNKAFGRAIKALVRQTNDGKINPAGRDLETVKRSFKCKAEDKVKFNLEYIPELLEINPEMEISILNEVGKYAAKYSFDIPLSYPIRIANMNYKYKSQYRPNPAGQEEVSLLRVSPNVSLTAMEASN